MLEWTQAGGGARLMMLVHHDDAEREWACGAESKIGTFSEALMAEAKENGWTVVTMKKDRKKILEDRCRPSPPPLRRGNAFLTTSIS